ncbi:MAG TPA: hypothetical protein PKL83_01600 [bacterium]|nr:hypothetical protein [bacterium]
MTAKKKKKHHKAESGKSARKSSSSSQANPSRWAVAGMVLFAISVIGGLVLGKLLAGEGEIAANDETVLIDDTGLDGYGELQTDDDPMILPDEDASIPQTPDIESTVNSLADLELPPDAQSADEKSDLGLVEDLQQAKELVYGKIGAADSVAFIRNTFYPLEKISDTIFYSILVDMSFVFDPDSAVLIGVCTGRVEAFDSSVCRSE